MPVSEYTPSVAEVAAFVSDRTFDAGGDETGTFSASTVPTGDQVTTLIDEAVSEAYPSIGEDVPDAAGPDPDRLRKAAKAAVTYRAAALVELRFFGKDVARGNSPYPQLNESWETTLKRVVRVIENMPDGDTPGGETSDNADVDFEFPENKGGMVGWGTRW